MTVSVGLDQQVLIAGGGGRNGDLAGQRVARAGGQGGIRRHPGVQQDGISGFPLIVAGQIDVVVPAQSRQAGALIDDRPGKVDCLSEADTGGRSDGGDHQIGGAEINGHGPHIVRLIGFGLGVIGIRNQQHVVPAGDAVRNDDIAAKRISAVGRERDVGDGVALAQVSVRGIEPVVFGEIHPINPRHGGRALALIGHGPFYTDSLPPRSRGRSGCTGDDQIGRGDRDGDRSEIVGLVGFAHVAGAVGDKQQVLAAGGCRRRDADVLRHRHAGGRVQRAVGGGRESSEQHIGCIQ